MAIIIDNIELDETNSEFNYASEFVKHTDKLVYLTGKAGTGKTTFLKYLKETTTKNAVILAPTGVAAINAGGQTIHSFFQIRPSVYVPNDKRLRTKPDLNDEDKSTIFDYFQYNIEKLAIIRGLELLIIDEISMVRCDLLDLIDRLLRVFRRNENEIFGGVQVVLIGDTFQLPPIADFQQWEILEKFYDSPFFFSSKIIQQNKPVYIELKKIYRQNEQLFIDLLNKIRINQVSQNEINLLNSKYNPTFSSNGNTNYITLATHNKIVDSTNLTKLSELPGELKLFEATITGIFQENIMPTDRLLQLKEGAQIMFIKNDTSKRFFNGKIAKINKIEDSRIIAELSEGNEITVEKVVWENIKYIWNEKEKKIEEETIGTFTQFPIKLAWAITVHKSQGLTFERVIADLGAAFTSGQVYVALSRCTTFSGLVLKTRVERQAIKTNPKVLQFAQNETPSTLIVKELQAGKADFYYKKLRTALKSFEFEDAYSHFIKAIKIRNDIETSEFKRFFLVFTSRFNVLNRKYFDSQKKLIELENKIKEQEETINNQQDKIEINNKKIVEQSNAIKLLLDSTENLEAKNLNHSKELSQKLIEIQNLNNSISSYKNMLAGHKKTIEELERQLQLQKVENNRIRNIKWYQKLTGKK
jgi:hypothetical protein